MVACRGLHRSTDCEKDPCREEGRLATVGEREEKVDMRVTLMHGSPSETCLWDPLPSSHPCNCPQDSVSPVC